MDEAQAWAFVQAVLDREAARLEADRRHALERGRFMPESGDDWGVEGGYLPGYYGGYYGYGYGYGFGDFGLDDRRLGDRLRTNRGFTEGLIPRGNHGRYSFLKGADVVPGPKSPGDRGHRSDKPGHRPGGGQVGHHGSGRR